MLAWPVCWCARLVRLLSKSATSYPAAGPDASQVLGQLVTVLAMEPLHTSMDQAVLNAYGCSDIDTTCGFGLDYFDLEDDAQLPNALQNRIDEGPLSFDDPNDALDFQGQLRATGAVKAKKKLPWRTAGLMTCAMRCSPACWRSTPSATKRW